MEIILREPIESMHELVPKIMHLFPGAQLKVPMLAKRRLIIARNEEKVAVALRLHDGNRITLKGQANTQNPTIMMFVIMGALCGLIGAIILLVVLFGSNLEERKAKTAEVYELLRAELE